MLLLLRMQQVALLLLLLLPQLLLLRLVDVEVLQVTLAVAVGGVGQLQPEQAQQQVGRVRHQPHLSPSTMCCADGPLPLQGACGPERSPSHSAVFAP